MTTGLVFALGAMTLFGIGDIVYKRAAGAGIEASRFMMLQAWVFCPAITIYALASGNLVLHPAAIWGSVAGLFTLVALTNFVRSLRDGAVSTNAPIFRLNFTLTAALAILFLGEPLSLPKLAALIAALIAVWLLLGERNAGEGKRATLGSLTRVLVATVCMAFANLAYKLGLQHGALPETMVTTQAWFFSSAATIYVWVRDRRIELMPWAWRYSVPASITLLVGYIFLLYALARGDASVMVPVAQMSFVFTALVGALAFGERLNTRKRAGLMVAVLALGLFALSAS